MVSLWIRVILIWPMGFANDSNEYRISSANKD